MEKKTTLSPDIQPVITIIWSESDELKEGEQMSIAQADMLFASLDEQKRLERSQPEYTGSQYDKTRFRIDFTFMDQPGSYEGKQDFGDGDGGLIEHIREHFENRFDEEFKKLVLKTGGEEAWRNEEEKNNLVLQKLIPYFESHRDLGNQERIIYNRLESGTDISAEQINRIRTLLDHIEINREMLNSGEYDLLQLPISLEEYLNNIAEVEEYKAHVREEIEEEAKMYGMTVEEYMENDFTSGKGEISFAVLENSNGSSYEILHRSKDMLLLIDSPRQNIIVAHDWNDETKSWAFGQYFLNTPEGLIRASEAYMKYTDPEKFQEVQRETVIDMEYKEYFFAVLTREDSNFKKLTESQEEIVFGEWLYNDIPSIVDTEKIYDICKDYDIKLGEVNEKIRLFVDMDGTLCEFRHCDTIDELYVPGRFAGLKENPAVIEGIEAFAERNPGAEVYVLSAYLAESQTALKEKQEWLDKYFPIPNDRRIFVPCGEDKSAYVPGGIHETDILLDDYTTNLVAWENAGGRGVKLMNGINGNKGTWSGDRIELNSGAEEYAERLSAVEPMPRDREVSLK